MSDSQEIALTRRRRRLNKDKEGQEIKTEEGRGLVVHDEFTDKESEAQARVINKGVKFKHPSEEFKHWNIILEAVQTEFINRSKKIPGGASVLKEEDRYLNLVDEVIQSNPHWGIQPIERNRLVSLLRNYQFGYGPVEDYMKLEDLEELYFNNYQTGYYIQNGLKKRIEEPLFSSEKDMIQFITIVANENGKEINASSPALDATLKDGSRLNATIPPIAYGGADFVIRKHKESPFTIDYYLQTGMITEEFTRDIKTWIEEGMNIMVSGGTSSGKTSFLNAIGKAYMPSSDRIIVIENTKELQIETEDFKYLETREDATREGQKDDITTKDLVRFSLRKRPDRIIVGELRGPEAYDALLAWNSGHDGSLSTLHANSAPDALNKIEQLALMSRQQTTEGVRSLIASTVDIIVQVRRYKGERHRRVVEVAQVLHDYKYDQFDEEVIQLVEELKVQKQLRQFNEKAMILTLYKMSDKGVLEKQNPMVPILR